MAFHAKRNNSTLALGLALFAVLSSFIWLEHYFNADRNRQLQNSYREIQRGIIDKQLDFIQFFRNNLQDTAGIERKWSRINEIAGKKYIDLNVIEKGEPVLWTHHDYEVKEIQVQKDTLYLAQTPNCYALVYQIRREPYTFQLSYKLKTNYSFRNQYIQNSFNDAFSFIQEGVISAHPIENMTAVFDITGKPVFYIQLFAFSRPTPIWLVLLLLSTFACLLICIHQIARNYVKSSFVITSICFSIFWLSFRWVNIFYHVPDFLYQIRLFNPVVYASSIWFPSLGDLVVDSSIVLWYFILLESAKRKHVNHTRLHPWLRTFVWFSLSIIASHLSIVSLKSLIIDSQISFEINNLLSGDYFAFIGLVTIIIQFLAVYFIVRNFTRSLTSENRKPEWVNLWFILSGILVYAAVALQFVQVTYFQLSAAILLFGAFAGFKMIPYKQNRFQQYFFVIFIIACIASVSIQHWVKLKEHENRKLFANNLVNKNDITTDYFLRNVEKKIVTDQYVLNYFENPLITKSQFEKRIRQIYFTGYLSKYEVNVLDYDSMGYHFRQRNIYPFKRIEQMYNTQTVETINSYFRYLKNSEEVKGYIARFVIRRGNNTSGILYILLKPKLIQDENRFDDLLIEGSKSNKKKIYNYSYAVYKDKFLIYQSGNFPYRTSNIWGETNQNYKFFIEENAEHLLYTDDQMLTVVVTKNTDNLTEMIGLFSFIFTSCSIFLIVILFFYVGINAQTINKYRIPYNYVIKPIRILFNKIFLIRKQEVFYIRTRIQTSIIFILFLTLFVTSFFTINFITQKYNARQTDQLMKKLRNVVLTIENENIRNYDWSNSNELEAFINQIADFYDTDIIFFNEKGLVIASSISKIYDEGIISRRMPPMAFYHLNTLKESQYTGDENIAQLKFQTACAPVFINKKEALGYIQLPYFSQKADLTEEITSIAVGFINLYVLLFILIGIIAFLISRNISSPLTLIQQKLSQTVLLGKNEPIVWQRDDEIGGLVRQYNAMIRQLEESARKLAETEREGAWRDIAKQIAHEIKNPLTPMKLSMQHLQRAFKNKDANIEEKVDRTAKLLISQIDTLSELATEFSSFAKMPAPVYEKIDVCNILHQIRDLYLLSSGASIALNCKVTREMNFDPSYLNRIVGNLVKNAIQAIPEEREGHVEITAFEDNDNIVIIVKDNGKGIPEEEGEKIFMPYFSTKITGIGLGLPIVKSMIESAQGSITFHSNQDQGTTFTIILPA